MTTLRRAVHWCARRPATYAVGAAVVVLSCLIGVAGSTWLLTGDFSHTEFLVRSIPEHPPLIGVAARVAGGGSTPGPSMAYLLWPVYTLFGANAFARVTPACGPDGESEVQGKSAGRGVDVGGCRFLYHR